MEDIYNNIKNISKIGSIDKFYNLVKKKIKSIKKSEVRKFLRTRDAYTLLLRRPRKFPRRRVIVSGPRKTISLDVMFLNPYSKQNDSISKLLVGIDIYSRFMYVQPLKNLKSITVIQAMDKILPLETPYTKAWTDKGVEFVNKQMIQFFKDRKIHLYHTFGDSKANICERSIQTLKILISRFLINANTERYINNLQQIVEAYNLSPHRTLKNKCPLEIHLLSDPHQIIEFSKNMYKKTKFERDI